jgi:hypothetical protein
MKRLKRFGINFRKMDAFPKGDIKDFIQLMMNALYLKKN